MHLRSTPLRNWSLILLLLALGACAPATSSVDDDQKPVATSLPVGYSRSHPYPLSESVEVPDWTVGVIDMIRGDQAQAFIGSTDPSYPLPPPGMEYLLVKLRVQCTYNDSAEHIIRSDDFAITGDRRVLYQAILPNPMESPLSARLRQGETAEGWALYLVAQSEGNILLVVDEVVKPSSEDHVRYIALEEGAAVENTADLSNLQATDIGSERENPAPLNTVVSTQDWQIVAKAVVRGAEAASMVQEAARQQGLTNEALDDGMEYLAVRVYARYINLEDAPTQVPIDSFFFKAIGNRDSLYDVPAGTVEPQPLLHAYLFPGGEAEGWIILQVAQGETDVVIVFGPGYNFTGPDVRFISTGT